ncbi:MAG: twin-arginine translocase TatA/TatE family subunit [Anaerolineales bacterium]|jgi:sec-independent protein translocase protein TatA
MNIRGWEPIIVLAIILLLFGPGRIGKVAGELGRSIREFRSGLTDDEDEAEAEEAEQESSE